MRCEDLTREIASPTGALDPAAMAGHLAACPACDEWSRRAEKLDRIWEATRPSGPSMDAMDALWARASAELDARKAAPAMLRLDRPGRRRWAMAGLVLAQAAAVLVAAAVLLRHDAGRPIAVAVREPDLLDLKVEPDMLPTVRIGKDNGVRVETDDFSYPFDSPSLPPETPKDLFDAAETMAGPGFLASTR